MRGVDLNKRILGVLIIIVAIVALHYTLAPARCTEISCFEAHMIKCEPATYINDESEAAWGYDILGNSGINCEVEVTLLIAKESNFNLRQYEGEKMVCSYSSGQPAYPEKNLALCTGPLKEGLQSIVIEKLYKYIVANIADFREEVLSY
ncbi:MAG: hypothetical protein AABW89_03170 [Nanoarchaeota archaeon]